MANENIRKEYSGGAVATTLAGNITAASTSITLTSGATYPTGAIGPFVVAIGRNAGGAEEHILCTSRSGNILTVLNRGYDGTAAVTHTAGDTVLHVLDANSINQANLMANIGTAAGDMLYFTAAGVVARRALGAAGYPLIVAGGVPTWQRLTDTAIDPAAAINRSKLLVPPYVALTKSGVQAIAHNTNTPIAWDQESTSDLSTMHDNAVNNSRITVPVAGLYEVEFTVEWATTAVSVCDRAAWISANGVVGTRAAYQLQRTDSTSQSVQSGRTFLALAATNYVETYMFQNSGLALNAILSANSTMKCRYVGPSA